MKSCWRPNRFRLARRTYTPWGCIVLVRVASLTKSRKLPTRARFLILPLLCLSWPRYHNPIFANRAASTREAEAEAKGEAEGGGGGGAPTTPAANTSQTKAAHVDLAINPLYEIPMQGGGVVAITSAGHGAGRHDKVARAPNPLYQAAPAGQGEDGRGTVARAPNPLYQAAPAGQGEDGRDTVARAPNPLYQAAPAGQGEDGRATVARAPNPLYQAGSAPAYAA